jgi:hypothetical protein
MNFFSQMNVFRFSFLVVLYPSLLLLLLMFIIYIYIYISIDVFFFFSSHHLFCVCMYVSSFLVIIFRRCMLSFVCVRVCIEKETTNNTIRVLPYICVQIFFTSVAAIELFTSFFSFRNTRQTFIVIGVFRQFSFSFSLSFCCCLMMFYVCKVCVCVGCCL